MASPYGNALGSNHSPYAPSAPSLPDSYGQQPPPQYYITTPATNYYGQQQQQQQQPYSSSQHGYGYNYNYAPPPPGFPPGTDPAVIRSFQMVDKDMSGFIDEHELQQALSSGYQRFSLRTIRLLIFLFNNPNGASSPLRLGPKEFTALWSCLAQWRTTFERYDRDRSGKIDLMELRDALYGLGFAVPPSVLQLLISKYDDGSGRRVELNFDSFVECGMIVKGLTEKFKEKDPRYTGSATFSYDAFMSMVIPFLVSYN